MLAAAVQQQVVWVKMSVVYRIKLLPMRQTLPLARDPRLRLVLLLTKRDLPSTKRDLLQTKRDLL